jgi:hypothetical protein
VARLQQELGLPADVACRDKRTRTMRLRTIRRDSIGLSEQSTASLESRGGASSSTLSGAEAVQAWVASAHVGHLQEQQQQHLGTAQLEALQQLGLGSARHVAGAEAEAMRQQAAGRPHPAATQPPAAGAGPPHPLASPKAQEQEQQQQQLAPPGGLQPPVILPPDGPRRPLAARLNLLPTACKQRADDSGAAQAPEPRSSSSSNGMSRCASELQLQRPQRPSQPLLRQLAAEPGRRMSDGALSLVDDDERGCKGGCEGQAEGPGAAAGSAAARGDPGAGAPAAGPVLHGGSGHAAAAQIQGQLHDLQLSHHDMSAAMHRCLRGAVLGSSSSSSSSSS